MNTSLEMLTAFDFPKTRYSKWNKAVKSACQFSNFEYDNQTLTIRRNLILSCTISILAVLMKKIESVNFGVIKGEPLSPELWYWLFSIVISYYFAWLYIHGRAQTITNRDSLLLEFFKSLALQYVQEKHAEIQKRPNNQNLSIRFEYSSSDDDKIIITGKHVEAKLERDKINERFAQFEEEPDFSLANDGHGQDYIVYNYRKKLEDFAFFNVKTDSFMLFRTNNIFVFLLPLCFAFVALIMLALKIAKVI